MALDEGKVTFRCSDLHHDCPWEVSGTSESEILPEIEQHGRDKHGLKSLDPDAEKQVRSAIRREAA